MPDHAVIVGPPVRVHTSASPNWDLVPFAVSCARCGHDLRGQTEPKCVACGLEFDWTEACPIEQLTCAQCSYHLYGLRETRCPECGREFTWQAALAKHRWDNSDLFEHRWRDRPVRAFLRTWWRSLRPGKFWRRVDIHDPPQPLALLIFFAAANLLVVAAFTLLAPVNSVIMNYWPPGAAWADMIVTYVTAITMPQATQILPLPAWTAFSFGSLVILRQSMARCRVRDVHVLRACIYAVSPLPLLLIPLVLALEVADSYAIMHISWPTPLWAKTILQMVPWAIGALVLSLPLFAVWSLWCAYGHYIRMTHSFAVAFLSQVIAVMATMSLAAALGILLSQ